MFLILRDQTAPIGIADPAFFDAVVPAPTTELFCSDIAELHYLESLVEIISESNLINQLLILQSY